MHVVDSRRKQIVTHYELCMTNSTRRYWNHETRVITIQCYQHREKYPMQVFNFSQDEVSGNNTVSDWRRRLVDELSTTCAFLRTSARARCLNRIGYLRSLWTKGLISKCWRKFLSANWCYFQRQLIFWFSTSAIAHVETMNCDSSVWIRLSALYIMIRMEFGVEARVE